MLCRSPPWRRTSDGKATAFVGGEAVALERLRGYESECVAEGGGSNGSGGGDGVGGVPFAPWLLEDATLLSTKLSPWLANG